MKLKKFENQLNQFDICLNEEQKMQFQKYFELLIEWNKVMNLTAITEREEVNEKHFVDSLAIAKDLDMNNVKQVIDIGTGAGFPGIPLKIAFPHLEIALLDSLQKRVKFLDEVISKLQLKKIWVFHGRAEDYARKEEHREKYDLCVSRAVANLASLSEYCIPYVKVDGKFVAYKSGMIDEEVEKSLRAIQILGGKVEKIEKFELPDSDIGRAFVYIKKVKNTSKKYPRKAGIPAKDPLL
ncbi:MAG: 16S rRNA (guanine(527)-N(7))-methyltransferase RsmG [Ruminococcus sp.]|nr:16S rRNA (guanine(527)-N(7))-methyltransferase RsmG [Ruminococcus sp.]